MKLKVLFAAIVCAFLGAFMLFQLNVMNVLATDTANPITAPISSVISPSPSLSPSPSPSPTPVPIPTSAPVSAPISIPSPSPAPVIAPVLSIISPSYATQGTIVTLTGSGFNQTSKIYVGGTLMPVSMNEVSQNGTVLKFILTTEVLFTVGNTYPVYVLN